MTTTAATATLARPRAFKVGAWFGNCTEPGADVMTDGCSAFRVTTDRARRYQARPAKGTRTYPPSVVTEYFDRVSAHCSTAEAVPVEGLDVIETPTGRKVVFGRDSEPLPLKINAQYLEMAAWCWPGCSVAPDYRGEQGLILDANGALVGIIKGMR